MANFELRTWEPASVSGLSRSQRRAGGYLAYVPDRLAGRRFTLDGDVAADISDAEREIAALDHSTSTLAGSEGLARILLRAESVASSRIEGLVVGSRRLLKADIARQMGEAVRSETEVEVLANIDAMAHALGAIDAGNGFSAKLLCDIHSTLLAPTSYSHLGGRIRTSQNWIGGNAYSPIGAAFVPPPPELVGELVTDLCAFCNSDSLPPLSQAAIAHAQFETIHPFADGNGRVGRALIHMILRRRGLTTRTTPPISLILATISKEYVEGLTATRYVGESNSPAASAGIGAWLETFSIAARRSVIDANVFEQRIRDMRSRWLTALGSVRADSALAKLIATIPGTPMMTPSGAAALIGRSLSSTAEAIARLADAGILAPTVAGRRRGQVYEAREVIEAFTLLERQLGSPAGDTTLEKPSRPAPSL
jgi:Fic family protein